jgi:hypothetical protein
MSLNSNLFLDLTDIPNIDEVIQFVLKEETFIKEVSARNKALIECYSHFRNINCNFYFETPYLSDKDIEISLKWYNGVTEIYSHVQNKNVLRNYLISKHYDDYELGRVLSARSAEKVASEFYKSRNLPVQDISIRQLNDNVQDNDWKYYDLQIDGQFPVDVKKC